MIPGRRRQLLGDVLAVYASREYGWTQGSYGKTRGGQNVWAAHPRARSVCLDGAIELVAVEQLLTCEATNELRELVTAELPGPWRDRGAFALEEWNDEPERVFAEVYALLRRAYHRAAEAAYQATGEEVRA